MRILIYGAGALGQTVGCMLASAGQDVDLILRPRFIEAIKKEGLTVTGIYGERHVTADQLGLNPAVDAVIDTAYDFVIITTKAYDTKAAVEEIARLAVQRFMAVTMQNGCGNLEMICERFGEARALGARIITGFEIVHPGRNRITVSADATHIGGCREGSVPDAAERLASAINQSGLPCIATPYVKRDLFAKLLYNCALNPLGAILGVYYGALADDPDSREIMNRIIAEAFSVIAAMDGTTHWQDAAAYQQFFYDQQVPTTYSHRPSMLQDIEHGKRTEVDALTGYVAAQGKRHGVATPTCDLVSGLVRFKERQAMQKKQWQ